MARIVGSVPAVAVAAGQAEHVLCLDADRPSAADLAQARGALEEAGANLVLRTIRPGVEQVAVEAPGPERTETVTICHLERSPIDPGVVEIEGVQTIPAWRARGLGAAVVTESAAVARAGGAEVVWLRTVAGGPAERLYRRLGFEVVGTLRS